MLLIVFIVLIVLFFLILLAGVFLRQLHIIITASHGCYTGLGVEQGTGWDGFALCKITTVL